MIDCRHPRLNRPYGAPICDAAHYRSERDRTAAVVAAGNRDSEIAMIGQPPVTLGALETAKATLTRATATMEQRRAAAELLIASTHGPFRFLGATFLGRMTDAG